MKYLILFLLFTTINKSYSSDSTKSQVGCKIMVSDLLPVSSGSNITNNQEFNKFIVRFKIKSIVKIHSNKYDSIGELKYKYRIYHDTNAYILADSLKKIIGIKEVYVYRYILSNNYIKNGESPRIYPNPVSNSLFVAGLSGNLEAEYEILSLNGRLIKSAHIDLTNDPLEIPVNDLPKGIYYFIISDNQRYLETKFFKE